VLISTPYFPYFLGRGLAFFVSFSSSDSASAIKLLMFWGGQVKQFFARGKQTAAVFKGLDRTIL